MTTLSYPKVRLYFKFHTSKQKDDYRPSVFCSVSAVGRNRTYKSDKIGLTAGIYEYIMLKNDMIRR